MKTALVLRSLLVVAALAAPAGAMPTTNTELVAVPAPGPVTIDGDLADWDLSGTIYSCPETRQYAGVAAVRSAAMYDAEGLYLSFRWLDRTPMGNQVDPDEPGKHDRGWASDSVQVRIHNETEVHLTAWYYAGGDKPALYAHFGKAAGPNQKPALAAGLANGARMAFRKHADGQGYTQEMFVPWKLVSASGKQYGAGDSFALGLHFNWGGRDNKSWRELQGVDVVANPQKVNRIFFWQDTSAWGRLSLSPKGSVTLEPKPWDAEAAGPAGPDLTTAGSVSLAYDLPAAGRVTLVIEDETGRRVRNLIGGYPRPEGPNVDHWDCLDDRGQPVAPGRYRWRGLVQPGITARYLAHVVPHTNPPWRNSAGTGGWGADHTPPSSVAAHSERVFLLYEGAESGSALVCCDLEGTKLWGHGSSFQGGGLVITADVRDVFYAAKKAVIRIDPETGKAQAFATGAKQLDFPPDIPPSGIARRGEQLFLSCASPDGKRSVLRVFDLKTDRQVREITTIPSLRGLAVDSRGRLLAVSGSGVVAVDAETGETTPVVASGLDQPRGIAVAGDGTIYVIEGSTQQLLAFDPAGKLLRAIGTKGGRPAVGPWDRLGLLNPTGVAVDGEGNIWVAEHERISKRLSKWSPDGQNVGEWFGPTPYGGDGIVDHRDPSRVLCGGLEFAVDERDGSARPVYSHLLGQAAGQPAAADNIVNGTFWHRQGFTTSYRGHDYLAYDRGLLCIRRGKAWVPCAAIGYVRNSSPAQGDQALWSDRNDDGKVSDDEVVTLADVAFAAEGAGAWGIPWSKHDLSTLRPVRHSTTRCIRFTPAEFTPSGVPIFDRRSVSTVDYAYGTAPVDVDADTMVSFYENSHVPGFVEEKQNHPAGDLSGIKAYDRKGRLAWTYPEPFSGVHGCFKAPLPTRPDEVIGTIYVMGTADLGGDVGTVMCFNGYYGPRYLFTTDGLFVQALFPDSRLLPRTAEEAVPGMPVDEMSPGSEAYGGTFSRADDGRFFLTGSLGGPACVLIGVEGLDHIRRLPRREVTVTSEQIAAGKAIKQARERARIAAGDAPERLKIERGSRVVDGLLDEPGFADEAVTIKVDNQRGGQAALSFDDDHLYVAFRVKDGTPWRNAGTDAKTIFLTGDSVDIQLGLDPVAGPKRKKPWPGDLRIAIAPFENDATVMLYQPIVKGRTGPREAFVSPVGRVEMDRVERITEARVAVTRTSDGYDLEAAIPLASLGFPFPVGRTIRGDVGVLFSDETGSKCLLRRYWSNGNTNIAADLPSETRLQPGEWGTVIVDR
jgi:sugar lactone lactonase YvrE